MVVLELIMVIFAILQIILFFKLWRMADNVNEIVRKMRFPYNKSESSYPESYSKFLFLLYNKSKGDAKEYLLKTVEEDVKHDTAKMIKEMEAQAK